MFKSLSIKNFRGIRDLEISGFGSTNIFLGPNNSGKTTVLEALFLMTGVSRPHLYISINNFRGLAFSESNDLRFNFFNLDFASELKLSAQLGHPEQKRILNIRPIFRSQISTILDKTANNLTSENSISATSNYEKATGLRFEIKIESKGKSQSLVTELNEIAQGQFEAKAAENYVEKLIGIFISSSPTVAQLAERVDKLIINKKKQEILPYLKEIDSNISDISLGKNQMVYFDIGASQLIPAQLSGDGIRKILSILVAIYNCPDGVVFIDEFDNGLHYSALSTAWRAVLKMARDRNVQLFITTHDKECLQNLSEVVKKEELQSFQSTIKSYTMKKIQGDQAKIYEYDFEKFSHSLNQDIEIRGIV